MYKLKKMSKKSLKKIVILFFNYIYYLNKKQYLLLFKIFEILF